MPGCQFDFLKPDCENLDFFNVFGFFEKPKQARRNLAFFWIIFRTIMHEFTG